MIRRLGVLAALVALGVALGGAGADAGTTTVSVRDDFFSPRPITVRKGTTVRFVWRGRNTHNVTGGGRASRTTRRRGYVYRRTFRRSTRIVCTVHAPTMRMTVRVR